MVEREPDAIRVLLAAASPLLRQGVRTLLQPAAGIEIVAETEEYKTVVQLCDWQRPHLLVLTVATLDAVTLALLRRLKEEYPQMGALVVAATCDEACVQAVVAAGADGYLLQTDPPSGLVAAIRAVAQGETSFSRPVVAALAQTARTEPESELTERQVDVLRLVADGQTNAQIAQALGISESTVRYHLRRAFRRLDAAGRTEAAMKAAELGLL